MWPAVIRLWIGGVKNKFVRGCALCFAGHSLSPLLRQLVILAAFIGQPEPTFVPAPTPAIEVTATEQVELGDPVRINVATEGKGLSVRVRQIMPGEDVDASANLSDLEGPGAFGFTSKQPGGYIVEAQAIVGDAIVTDAATFHIGPAVTVTTTAPQTVADPQQPLPAFSDIRIVGPAGPITKPGQVRLKVTGLDDAELRQASIHVSPEIDYSAVKTWTGENEILVQVARETASGQYAFAVAVNQWRVQVEEGLVAARAAGVSQDLLDEYAAIVAKLAAKYQHKQATCVIEVALGPFQPPVVVDPNQPPPVDPNNPNKVTQVTFVFEKDESNTPRPVALALQKLNSAGVLATEFEEDSVDGSGEVPDQYKIALAKAREAGLPALVVQSGDTVKRVIKNPRTEAEVMQAIAP